MKNGLNCKDAVNKNIFFGRFADCLSLNEKII